MTESSFVYGNGGPLYSAPDELREFKLRLVTLSWSGLCRDLGLNEMCAGLAWMSAENLCTSSDTSDGKGKECLRGRQASIITVLSLYAEPLRSNIVSDPLLTCFHGLLADEEKKEHSLPPATSYKGKTFC